MAFFSATDAGFMRRFAAGLAFELGVGLLEHGQGRLDLGDRDVERLAHEVFDEIEAGAKKRFGAWIRRGAARRGAHARHQRIPTPV